MDAISIADLRVECIVGIREREQRALQPLVIDATLHVPLAAAAAAADLGRTVNYAAIAQQLAFVAAHGQWGLLESLAHAMCGLLPGPTAAPRHQSHPRRGAHRQVRGRSSPHRGGP